MSRSESLAGFLAKKKEVGSDHVEERLYAKGKKDGKRKGGRM